MSLSALRLVAHRARARRGARGVALQLRPAAGGRDGGGPARRAGRRRRRRALIVERARPIGEQRAGGALGPMNVFEHEQHGTRSPRSRSRRPQPRTGVPRRPGGRRRGGVAAQRRHQGGQLRASGGGSCGERRFAVADQRPKRSQQRGVGDIALTEVDALPGQRVAPALPARAASSATSRVFPTPESPATRATQGAPDSASGEPPQAGQLALATDEAGARHAGCHHASMPR